MKSIIVNGFLVFLVFFFSRHVFSQTNVDDYIKGDTKVFGNILNSKGTKGGSVYLKKIEFQPYVVTENETFSLTCTVKINGIHSIIVYLGNIGNSILYNNNPADSLILFDNGLNGDLKANDSIFTISKLKISDYSQIDNVGEGTFVYYCDVKYIFTDGNIIKENINFSIGMRCINSKVVEIPEVYKINDTIQYSSHVINFAMDWNWDQSIDDYYNEYRRITGAAFKTYYKYFPDDRDFFSICTTYPNPESPAGQYGGVRNHVIGISDCPYNNCLYDYSSYYGSNGRLMGMLYLCYSSGGQPVLLNHELLHRWAADLNPNLHLTDGTGHWGTVEFPSSGFGSGWQRSHIYHYKDSIYRAYLDDNYSNRYNTLELYLMGLLPLDSVSFPLKTLVHYKYLDYTLFDTSVVPNLWGFEYRADSIHYVTKDEFLKYMLLRNPSYSTSQKNFTMALIVISDRLLAPTEMAYYNYIMKENEKRDPQVYSNSDYMGLNFYNATGGRGTLTTRLPEMVNKDVWNTSYPLPTDSINLFISQDSTPQAEEYNALTTKAARDAILVAKLKSDITTSVTGQVWNFNKATPLFIQNSHDWGKRVYKDDKLLYDGYDGDNKDSILLHEGTTKYVGTLGIPTYDAYLPDVVNRMNIVVTGDKLADGSSLNCIEVPGQVPVYGTNVQPGQILSNSELCIPENTNTFMIYYSYLYRSITHDKNLARIPVVLFKIVGGKYEFVATNPNVKLIMERVSIPPIINIKLDSAPDSLIWNIVSANFKSAYYVIDDGVKLPIEQNGGIKLGLKKGNHIITVYAYDNLNLSSEKTIDRLITAIEDTPTFEENIKIYPNPANQSLYIELGNILLTKLRAEVYSSDGTLNSSQVFQGKGEKRIGIERLSKGIYYLKITLNSPGGEVKTVTKKFVKY